METILSSVSVPSDLSFCEPVCEFTVRDLYAFLLNVYLFLREGRGREREEDRGSDSSEPDVGLKLMNCKILT